MSGYSRWCIHGWYGTVPLCTCLFYINILKLSETTSKSLPISNINISFEEFLRCGNTNTAVNSWNSVC